MSYADWALLVIIALSVAVGLWRGFIKEALALAIWAAAFFVAFYYSGPVADLLAEPMPVPSARTAAAFAGLFLVVLVIGGLVNFLIGKLVEKTGLSGTDRLMGGIFGAVRGLLLVLALMILAGFTPVPEDSWWKSSRVIQSLLPLSEWAAGFLPDSVEEFFELYPEVENLPETEV